MRPVRPGTRGPAVEDIQRRLLALGYDIGPAGVDGVFMGATAEAVRAFQRMSALAEDSVVGDETWSALVRAGLVFGDRTLYLRVPHFHGEDVRVLQLALNALGFTCGAVDGIFGAYTERAVREFQRNAGLPDDGIVGPGTAGTINNLKHVWEGKDGRPHSAATGAPARAAEVLMREPLAVIGDDEAGQRIAERVENLALATTELARLRALKPGDAPEADAFVFHVCGGDEPTDVLGRPRVRMGERDIVNVRLTTAVAVATAGHREVVLEFEGRGPASDLEEQRAAVTVLDALCRAFD